MNSIAEGFDSKYRYVLVAARRARQLLSGARPQVDPGACHKPCRIAMNEIKAGKVKWTTPEAERTPVEVANELLDKAITVPAKE